ncbi:MAG TPA: hypothetical protein VGS23_06940 [Thermoplasmata archaeon]|nr:hypothetical protein [Thermoplasmata archaeon]
MSKESGLNVTIERRPPVKLYPFERFFGGFADVPPVRGLFGAATQKVLRGLKVEFFSGRFGYMSTSDVDGHLLINLHHLKEAEFRTVYLDIVHELCHVRQFRRKQPLFYPKLSYVDAPSEIEAYRITVREGRRLGMTDRELFDYLHMFWLSPSEHRRLARRVGLAVPRPVHRRSRTLPS